MTAEAILEITCGCGWWMMQRIPSARIETVFSCPQCGETYDLVHFDWEAGSFDMVRRKPWRLVDRDMGR